MSVDIFKDGIGTQIPLCYGPDKERRHQFGYVRDVNIFVPDDPSKPNSVGCRWFDQGGCRMGLSYDEKDNQATDLPRCRYLHQRFTIS